MNAEELAQAKMSKLHGGECITVTFGDSGQVPEIWLRGSVAASDDVVASVEIGIGRDMPSRLNWGSGMVIDLGILHSGFRKRASLAGRVGVRWLRDDGAFSSYEVSLR